MSAEHTPATDRMSGPGFEPDHASKVTYPEAVGHLYFWLENYHYRQLFYRFTGDESSIRATKEKIKVLIKDWGSKVLSDPEANQGEALLSYNTDPVCFITGLELPHPQIFVVAADPKLLDVHYHAISSLLPLGQDTIALVIEEL